MTDSKGLALGKSATAGVAMLALAACASTSESDVYTDEELSRLESYKVVQVVSAEQVKLDPETSGLVGGGLGAASGGLIGSQVSGSGVVVVALAAIGGIIGYAVEQQATDTVATRYVITVDGSQQVLVQKDTDEPLQPGDVAMLIGDYKPRLVKAPPDVVKSASENGTLSGVRVDEETGVIYFDQELEGETKSQPGGGNWQDPGAGSGEEAEGANSVYSSGSWAAPDPKDWPEEESQQ